MNDGAHFVRIERCLGNRGGKSCQQAGLLKGALRNDVQLRKAPWTSGFRQKKREPLLFMKANSVIARQLWGPPGQC